MGQYASNPTLIPASAIRMKLTPLQDLLGQGWFKQVYQHPNHADRVIKVINPAIVTADGCFADHKPYKRQRQQGIYRQFRREIIQYLQLCKNHYGTGQFIFPVETPYGLEPTAHGLGLVTEKVSAPDGQGWTLERLAQSRRLEAQHYAALERLFDDCERLHIVFGDVNIGGLMYTESRHQRPEFVLVDGMGEKLFIPLRSMSPRINRNYLRKVQRRLMAQIAQHQAQLPA